MSRLSANVLRAWPSDGPGPLVKPTDYDIWSAWGEVIPTTATAVVLAGVVCYSGNASDRTIQIGIGPAGSEQVFTTLQHRSYATGNPSIVWFEVPIAGIGAGVRVAARIRTADTGGGHWNGSGGYVSVLGYEGSPDCDHVTASRTIAIPEAGGIAITPSGTSWGNSAWAEMTPGLADAVGVNSVHLHPGIGGAGLGYEIDLGIGAAGAEQIVTTKRAMLSAPAGDYFYGGLGFGTSYLIPANTRIVVRLRKSGTSTANWGSFALTVYNPAPIVPTEYEPNPDADVTGHTIGIPWVEHRDNAGVLHVSSKVPLPDPQDYYGGWKEPDITEWGTIRRALSDWRRRYEGTSFRWRHSDAPNGTDHPARFWRGLLSNDDTKIMLNDSVVIRMISDAARRDLELARTIVRGVIRKYKPVSPLAIEFQAEDWLTQYLAREVPYRRVATSDFTGAFITDANGTQPMECVGKAVPIIYGEMSDQNVSVTPGTALTTPVLVDVTVVGGTAGVTKRYAITLGNADYAVPDTYAAWSDHRGETDPLWVTVNNAPTDEDMRNDPDHHYLVISIADQVGATRGRCYGRYPNSEAYGLDGLDRPGAFGIVPSDQWQYWEARRPYGAADWNSLKRHGTPPTTNNTGGTSVDTGRGTLAPLYVGVLDGFHCWLVAGHACKAILGWYVDGVRKAESTAGASSDWLIPGRDGWTAAFGATPYRDINGHRYTLIYGRQGHPDPDDCASGEKVLTINVQGIDDAGDGSGTLITKLLEQYEHFLVNWAFGDYQSGAWLEAPLFPADPAPEDADVLHMVDHDSFVAADAIADARVTGGYVGAWAITDISKLDDIIQRLNTSADVDCGFNRKTQYSVWMEEASAAILAAARIYTQERDIFERSFDIEDREDQLFNDRPYAYGYRPADNTWIHEVLPSGNINTTSIAQLREMRTAERLNLFMVRASGVATDIATRALQRTSYPPRYAKFRTGMGGLNDELGSIVRCRHTDGIGSGGWVNHPLRIHVHEFDPEANTVMLRLRDMHYLFSGYM